MRLQAATRCWNATVSVDVLQVACSWFSGRFAPHRSRPPECRPGGQRTFTTGNGFRTREFRGFTDSATSVAKSAHPNAHPDVHAWYSFLLNGWLYLSDGRAAGVEPATPSSWTLSSLEVTRFRAMCSAKI